MRHPLDNQEELEYDPKSSALHITVYDLSGAPLNPEALDELKDILENFIRREKLVISYARR